MNLSSFYRSTTWINLRTVLMAEKVNAPNILLLV